jgi:O-antigen ligase
VVIPERQATFRLSRGPSGVIGVISLQRPGAMRGLSWVAFLFLWLFVFSIAWENILIIPSIGTAGKLLGVAAFAIGLLAVIDKGHVRNLAVLHALMGAFVIWGSFTYFWTTYPDRTKEEVLTYFQLLLMVWLIREIASSELSQRRLMSAYVLGTYVSSALTFQSFLDGTAAHYHRYAAEGFNPGDLALMLVLSIPFAIYLASDEKYGILRWLYRLHLAVTTAAILLTAARGAVIDLGFALLIIPLSYSRWNIKQQLAFGMIMILGAITAAVVIPQSSWTRLGSISQEVSSGTLNERRVIWKAGFDVFRSHPIQGIGVNTFAPTVQRALGAPRQLRNSTPNEIVELVAHNTFISVLVEEGLIGFVLFVLILAGLWQGASTLRTPEKRLWMIVLLVWTVGVMELTWEYRKPTWLLFGLLAASITAVRPKGRPVSAAYRRSRSLLQTCDAGIRQGAVDG